MLSTPARFRGDLRTRMDDDGRGCRRGDGRLLRCAPWKRHLVGPARRRQARRRRWAVGHLGCARDAIRRLKDQAPLHKPTRVLLRGGVYAVGEPVAFFEGDSGTKEAPISYAAYPGERPILSGGIPIAGWKKAEGPLWTTTVPGVKEGRWFFRSLFVDGKRCTPARTPNEGSEFAADVIKPLHRSMQDDVVSSYGLRYHDQDIKPWSNLDDAVVVVYHAWTAARHCIASVDFAHKIVRFTNRGQFPVGWCAAPRYYVENVREALDAPGEFYLDRKTGLLSYYPRQGEDMTQARAMAPRPETLLKLEGNAAGNMPVDYLRFEGITFEHTDWVMPRDEMVDIQSAAFLKTATILCRGVRHSTFERCDFAHLSGYALWLERGCTDDRVVQCHMHDLAPAACGSARPCCPACTRNKPSAMRCSNCFIHDGGRVFHAGMGVWIGCTPITRCCTTTSATFSIRAYPSAGVGPTIPPRPTIMPSNTITSIIWAGAS